MSHPLDGFRIVLVRPHYPENVGAAARAMKTMGLSQLVVVRPSRLASPRHELACKMAVKAWDVLEAAQEADSLAAAVLDVDTVAVTTGRTGIGPVQSPRSFAEDCVPKVIGGASAAIVFGNEKTGLSRDDMRLGTRSVRVPMAAPQPSINLAQAVQIISYELFVAYLPHRALRAAEEPA